MKKIFIILSLVTMALFFSACSDENIVVNEVQDLELATTLTGASHNIEVYTHTGTFRTGYNEIFLQIKTGDGNNVNDAKVSWQPMMHMMGMSHSCPASPIAKKENAESTYSGYIVFQMASNDMEYWELSIDYSIDDASYTAKQQIQVDAASRRVVESFKGNDEARYIIAIVEPMEPRVAINDMKAVLYKMESMMNFTPVEGYKIKIDPRMPGMGNHTSPNNVDLSQGDDDVYEGKLSLTMTGYWKINLQLENAAGTLLKGEPVTGTVEGSSIFFEIEF